MNYETWQNIVRIIATACCGLQLYAWGPSIGLALTHGLIIYAVWLNRERN